MTALFHLFRLRSLLILAALLFTCSALSAQEVEETSIKTNKKTPNTAQTSAQKAALEAEKNTNNLRKINLLLSIAQDRDRQEGEETEAIRSRRLHVEEDLADAEDTPKKFSKKERADLETELKVLQKKEKVAQNTRKMANNFLLDVTQALAAAPTKRAKFLESYERKHGHVNDSNTTEKWASDAVPTTPETQAKSVVVSEKSKMPTEETPSVQTPISTDNAVENSANVSDKPSKNKKDKKLKKNESPKKVVEKASKKKTKKEETPKPTEDFPLVLTEARTTPVVEPAIDNTPTTPVIDATIENTTTSVVEQPKGKKKTSKKEPKTKQTDIPEPTLVTYRTYDRKADVFMNTPTPECAIAFDGKDDFTGKMKRETYPKRFFTHTDDVMRKALLDKDFITCDITGTKIEGSRYTYLNLTFTILSKDIQRSIGFLDKGTPIIFVLVNGSKVTLRTNKTDIGVVDIDKGTTTYRAQLTAETDITDSELDYVRVNWSSGYEDYEVFDVEILKNLFNCLYKK